MTKRYLSGRLPADLTITGQPAYYAMTVWVCIRGTRICTSC